ncbi:MAG: inorganic phosphate transporter [Ignisphaera sp.]|nr:inorganic phosphate transporter [Ignisphaera sp.]MCX8167678.1 inorganic phosphate transporter [Ignisphaera sp.]MDW8085668.1 inorganic phosphate transporter [Ignisphaera sp.]
MIILLVFLTVILGIMDGLNNAANALGWALGGRTLTLKRALLIASISQLVGGLVLGVRIINTISYELLLNLEVLDTVITPLAVCISTIIWSAVASIIRIPISFSMAVIGSIIGAVVGYSASYINWSVVLNIFTGWIVAFFASAAFTLILLRLNDGIGRHWRVGLFIRGLFIAILLALLISQSLHFSTPDIPVQALYIFILLYPVLHIIFRYNEGISTVTPLLLISMIHGANDSALIASILMLSKLGECWSQFFVLIPAIGIAVGTLMWGHRIANTFAGSIAFLDVRYVNVVYLSKFISMSILLVLGLPTPISLVTIGALMGFSAHRGLDSVRVNYAAKITLATIASTPVCIGLSCAAMTAIKSVIS